MIDPFAPGVCGPDEAESPAAPLSLFELNSMVRATLRLTLPGDYWVAAEVAEARVASNGHCYLELVQKDDLGQGVMAKARATVWRKEYAGIAARFTRQTGGRIEAGIKILARVEVCFYEQYGYSLNITDIDPSYTLGDLARRRKETVRRLEEDGVMGLNKELPLPRPVMRVAVISSPTAAGWGDFRAELEKSGLPFVTRLFPAAMQGEKVESTVIAALDAIAAERERWDVAVIIRGGGATTDLGCFDSYLLAANVAQFPLPVLTGIGHERDDTVTDLVAHTRLKTPTAVAAFLVELRAGETAQLDALRRRLADALRRLLAQEERRSAALAARLRPAATAALAERRAELNAAARRYALAATRFLSVQKERLLRHALTLHTRPAARLREEEARLARCTQRLTRAVPAFLAAEERRLAAAKRAAAMAGPERILALGFSITTLGGKAVRDAARLRPGDVIETRLANGTLTSTVTSAVTDAAEGGTPDAAPGTAQKAAAGESAAI